MKIIVAGGRDEAYYLTKSLKARGHEVTVVNKDDERSRLIADTYEVCAVCGDASDAEVLRCACASGADLLIALGDSDAENLIVCEIAKKQFKVPETFAVVNDPERIRLFGELGVDACVSIAQAVSDRIGQKTDFCMGKNGLPR